ncbi:MAG: hypothetical protein ACKN9E_14615 [Microcystaceae cyanobacterium]
MSKQSVCYLVVDASVARAAGDPPSNCLSQVCRDFLVKMKELEYSLYMTPAIGEEWDRHASRFSRAWQKTMIAKRQWLYQKDSEDNALRERIEKQVLYFYPAVSDETIFNIKNAIFKDYCLIEAALASGDKRVISLDDKTARRYFSQAAKKLPEIQGIIWVNPDKPEEDAIIWLTEGIPDELKRYLENWIC